MKVFISWSGRRSHEVADTLAGWLKKVIQSVEPWVSTEMERGVKWLDVLGKSLDAHSAGILCVTPGNFMEPWLNFEAGALSKQIGDEVRVMPYLLDFRSPSDFRRHSASSTPASLMSPASAPLSRRSTRIQSPS